MESVSVATGYLVDPFQNRTITVLQIPYEVERFGYRLDWEPYEVWNGHHRALPTRTWLFRGKSSDGKI